MESVSLDRKMFRDINNNLTNVCKILVRNTYLRKRRHVSVALVLVLALLVFAVQVLSPSDWRKRTSKSRSNKVVSTPSQSGHQTRHILPQCLIAGVKKCGTSTLRELLSLHTDVATAPREVHFFDVSTTYKKGREWYRKQMPATRPHQLTIETSSDYFASVRTPERVKSLNSSIRLLFIVKDPVVRMISHYVQFKRTLNDSKPPEFETYSGGVNVHSRGLQVSLYHLHLRRWLDSFPRSQVHIVDGDVLISDPATELRKVETFLGLEHQLTSDKFYRNESRSTRTQERKHPMVTQEVVDKLCKFFRPHNQLFFKLVGQEFNWTRC